jgi:predicted MPP superfamily phosphohydrolase
MKLLRQSSAQLHWKGESIKLIGIDYQHDQPISGSALPSLNGAETLVRKDMPNILLSHNPNTFPAAAKLGIELSLAGHTHGGQVNLGIVRKSWSPARFMTNFVAGLYQLPMASPANSPQRGPSGSAYLYVNRGIGTLGVPARLGARPEITLLTLRSGS